MNINISVKLLWELKIYQTFNTKKRQSVNNYWNQRGKKSIEEFWIVINLEQNYQNTLIFVIKNI